MRVGMVSYYYWPGLEGGAERQCRRVVAELAELGAECTVFTARRNREWPTVEMDGGARIVRLPSVQRDRACDRGVDSAAPDAASPATKPRRANGLRSLAGELRCSLDIDVFCAALAMRIRTRRLDVLHVHSSTSIAGACSWLGHRFGLPVIIKEVTYPAFQQLERFVIGNPLWQVWRQRAYVQAQHTQTVRDLVSKGVPPDRIFEIPNGIDLPEVEIREERPNLVLFVGNLYQGVEVKGLDTLVAAWSIVARKHPQSRLALAGRGNPSAVSQMAAEAGVLGQIEFLGHVENLNEWYSRASILVLPSRQEGMSNVLLEAMSWGIPVVATDIPGNRAVISSPATGILVPPDQPDAMAVAISSLLDDAVLRRQMGEAARCHIVERFEIGGVARRLAAAYQKMIDASASSMTGTARHR